MKKFFLFAAALMVSMAMMAQTTIFEWGDMNQSSLPDPTVGTLETVSLDGYAEVKINTNVNKVKGLKCGSSMMNSNAITKYYKIKPATGGFEVGDTIIYTHVYNNSSEKTTTIAVGSISDNTILYTGHQTLNGRNADGWTTDTCVLSVDADSLALGRVGSTGTFILSIKVIRPADSGTPTLKVSTDSIALHATAAYPNPSTTVTFTGKNLTPGTYNLTTPSQMTYWTINPTSVTVSEDGKLNAEITIGYTGNEVVEDEKSSIGLSINGITKNVIIYATSDMQKNFATSVNIEGWVVANGKKTSEFKSVLSAANIEYSKIDELDSLSTKTKRNEPYLGLKLKTQGAYMACWIQAGQTIRVKFGNVAASVKAYINGAEQTFTPEQLATPLEYTAIADTYVKFETTSGGTVVVKQIMIDEPIVDVMYTITYADSEHGTTTGWTIAYPNEKVYITFAPDENYIVMHCDYNGTEIVGIPQEPEWFIMPAAHVTVTTLYDLPNAIDNTDAAVKATKVIRDGKLFIMKNGVMYDAQGAAVR